MNGFFVFFDSELDDENHTIDNIMYGFPRWAKLQNCAWFCCFDGLASDVRDRITRSLKQNHEDQISVLVINVTDCGWATYKVPKNITDWMRNRLKSDSF